jgi:hypothetical protein
MPAALDGVLHLCIGQKPRPFLACCSLEPPAGTGLVRGPTCLSSCCCEVVYAATGGPVTGAACVFTSPHVSQSQGNVRDVALL